MWKSRIWAFQNDDNIQNRSFWLMINLSFWLMWKFRISAFDRRKNSESVLLTHVKVQNLSFWLWWIRSESELLADEKFENLSFWLMWKFIIWAFLNDNLIQYLCFKLMDWSRILAFDWWIRSESEILTDENIQTLSFWL